MDGSDIERLQGGVADMVVCGTRVVDPSSAQPGLALRSAKYTGYGVRNRSSAAMLRLERIVKLKKVVIFGLLLTFFPEM